MISGIVDLKCECIKWMCSRRKTVDEIKHKVKEMTVVAAHLFFFLFFTRKIWDSDICFSKPANHIGLWWSTNWSHININQEKWNWILSLEYLLFHSWIWMDGWDDLKPSDWPTWMIIIRLHCVSVTDCSFNKEAFMHRMWSPLNWNYCNHGGCSHSRSLVPVCSGRGKTSCEGDGWYEVARQQ